MSTTALLMLFTSLSQTQGLPQGLLSALCFTESSHKVNAIHHDDGTSNSVGVCQIKLNTARVLGYKGTEVELMNPEVNAAYAAKYLKKQIMRYNGNIPYGVAAYNTGTLKLGKSGNPVNQKYVKKVFLHWSERR